jgi:NADH-ubiquinone oxidoreductase chain 4
VFVVLDLFLFYIFFESVLIPLFFIIIIWGGSKKDRAAFLLFLYTLTGSLFMLLAILYIYQNIGSTDFLILSVSNINLDYQKILWLAFFISFAIKTPLFPFHIWLFRAHAEAPLAGSIILAAVITVASYTYLKSMQFFLRDFGLPSTPPTPNTPVWG